MFYSSTVYQGIYVNYLGLSVWMGLTGNRCAPVWITRRWMRVREIRRCVGSVGWGGWLSAESESAIVEDSVQARREAWVAQETTGVFWVSWQSSGAEKAVTSSSGHRSKRKSRRVAKTNLIQSRNVTRCPQGRSQIGHSLRLNHLTLPFYSLSRTCSQTWWRCWFDTLANAQT